MRALTASPLPCTHASKKWFSLRRSEHTIPFSTRLMLCSASFLFLALGHTKLHAARHGPLTLRQTWLLPYETFSSHIVIDQHLTAHFGKGCWLTAASWKYSGRRMNHFTVLSPRKPLQPKVLPPLAYHTA